MITLQDSIKSIERSIAYLSFELAYGWDTNGHPVFRTSGDDNQFTIPPKSESAVMDGYITHNHPSPHFAPPSLADLRMYRRFHLKEMRSCAVNGRNWKIIEHCIIRKNAVNMPQIKDEIYLSALYKVFDERKIQYKKDPVKIFIVPNKPGDPKIVDAIDEAMRRLQEPFAFTYIRWSD